MEQTCLDQRFEKRNFSLESLSRGEYENCSFIECDFSNFDLSQFKFSECEFIGCNLSLVKLINTAFREVKFRENKMLGMHFETCNSFALAFSFENCILDHSSFFRNKIKGTIFKYSQLHEVDFTESDLANSVFKNCSLLGARFDNTILEKVDFTTSVNYSIDPDINKIKKARFSIPAVTGLLNKYDIEII